MRSGDNALKGISDDVLEEPAFVSAHSHNHCADHRHGRAAGHLHAPLQFGTAFAIGTFLNPGFVAVEFVCGLL